MYVAWQDLPGGQLWRQDRAGPGGQGQVQSGLGGRERPREGAERALSYSGGLFRVAKQGETNLLHFIERNLLKDY